MTIAPASRRSCVPSIIPGDSARLCFALGRARRTPVDDRHEPCDGVHDLVAQSGQHGPRTCTRASRASSRRARRLDPNRCTPPLLQVVRLLAASCARPLLTSPFPLFPSLSAPLLPFLAPSTLRNACILCGWGLEARDGLRCRPGDVAVGQGLGAGKSRPQVEGKDALVLRLVQFRGTRTEGNVSQTMPLGGCSMHLGTRPHPSHSLVPRHFLCSAGTTRPNGR